MRTSSGATSAENLRGEERVGEGRGEGRDRRRVVSFLRVTEFNTPTQAGSVRGEERGEERRGAEERVSCWRAKFVNTSTYGVHALVEYNCTENGYIMTQHHAVCIIMRRVYEFEYVCLSNDANGKEMHKSRHCCVHLT